MTLDPILKKIDLKAGEKLFKFGLSPESDWKKILIITITLSVLVSVLNVIMFLQVDKGEIFTIDPQNSEDSLTLDINELEETTEYYQNKALEFEKIKNGATAGVDPSV